MEDVDWLRIINASPVACFFQNKLMLLLKIMLMYDLYWAANLQYARGHLPATSKVAPENSLKYWKKMTTMLELLILEGNSQNRNMVYFRVKYSLPSCLTLAINHTTN